jgi:glycerol-3-phosphate dehydrogenase (NAD(P)+)
MKKATVIGDGGWGTALAMVLHGNGHRVCVWGPFADYLAEIRRQGENTKFLSGVKLPPEIEWTSDHAQAVAESELVVVAVPSRYFGRVLKDFAGLIPADVPVVSVTKGFDESDGRLMTEVAEALLQRESVLALSGPSHAEEVARGTPTAVVLAGRSLSEAETVLPWFMSRTFRVYSSDDGIGVQLGGAVKNVIAIAVGACDGLGFGDNTKAALITRGLAEITRLGLEMGARLDTFAGLSGMGDLIVTCGSRHSRNRSVGERLGRGETMQQISDSMEQVAEGVWNCVPAKRLADRYGVEMPITNEVHAVIYENKNIRTAVEDLLERSSKPETPLTR